MVSAAGGWSGVQLRNVQDAQKPRPVSAAKGPGPDAPKSSQLAFNRDGSLPAGATEDSAVRLGSVAEPERPYLAESFRAFGDAVDDAVMSGPHGRHMVTASGGIAAAWDLGDIPEIVADATGMACRSASGGFDRDDWKKQIPDIPFRQTCPKG